MKRFLSILLCILMVALLAPATFAADEGFADVLSNRMWHFDESDDVLAYGQLQNANKESTTCTVGIVDDVLVITKNDGSNPNISFLKHGANIYVSVVDVKFRFNVNGVDPLVKFTFRDNGVDWSPNPLEFQGGNVKFLNKTVGTYAKNTWYSVEMYVDIVQGYGVLKMKADSAETWNEYHVLASTGYLNGKTHTDRLSIGLQTNNGILYVDDYYQNTTNPRSLVFDSDDFAKIPEINEADTDGMSQNTQLGTWKTMNVNAGLSAGKAMLNGNAVLKIKALNNQNGANSSVYKNLDSAIVDSADSNAKYVFKFKFGGYNNTSSHPFGVSLGTSDKEIFIATNVDKSLNMFAVVGSDTENVNLRTDFGEMENNTLYDVEALYSRATGKLRVVATNAAGKQVSRETNLTGKPTKIAFRNHVAAMSDAAAYFDDFSWGILSAGAPVFISSDVASGDKNNASLDETAIFTYDRTIDQALLSQAEVSLDGVVIASDKYTITSKGNQVMVRLNEMAKNTSYKIGISGVTDLAGTQSDELAEVTFKTSAKDIEVAELTLDETALKAKINSWYALGKSVKLIAAVYNSAETKIKDVEVLNVVADSRNEEEYASIALSDLSVESGDIVKGFVWSDFNSMVPYIASVK